MTDTTNAVTKSVIDTPPFRWKGSQLFHYAQKVKFCQ